MERRLLVLGWHNVEGTPAFPSPGSTGPRGLHRQLLLLRGAATVVALGPALRDLAEGRPLPARAVALTFDDGYADNATLAAPMLRRLGLPATFFLVPGLLSRTVDAWWETLAWAFERRTADAVEMPGRAWRLSGPQDVEAATRAAAEHLKTLDGAARHEATAELVDRLRPAGPAPAPELFMDWDGARDLLRMGFEIGSHTCGHDILSRETGPDQARDLLQARRELQEGLDVPADLLAYPNGRAQDYDAATLRAAETAGHSFAVTTVDGYNDRRTPRYEVRRTVVYPQGGVRHLLATARAVRRLDRAGFAS